MMTSSADKFCTWAGMPQGSLHGWDFHEVQRDHKVAAVAATSGTEIHFAADPAWHGRLLRSRAIRAFLEPLFERRGLLTTRVVKGNEVARRFIERLGFVQTRDDDRFSYYMLSALPYSRET